MNCAVITIIVSAKTIIKLGRLKNVFRLLSEPELTLGKRGKVFAKIRQTSAAPKAMSANVFRHP